MVLVAFAITGPAHAQPPLPTLPGEPVLDPAAARVDLEAGIAKLSAGEIGPAVELLKAAASKDPSSARIANELGYALARLGARREAEAQYRRALELEPRAAEGYANLVELVAALPERWQRRGEMATLIDRGDKAVGADPRGRALIALAAARFAQSVGRLAEARQRLDNVLAGDPPASLRKRAIDQLAAISEDDRALVLADWPEPPLPADARTALAALETELEANRLAGAARPLAPILARATALVDAHPTNAEPRFLRARVLEALARHDEASRELTLLLQLQPSHAGGWRLLGTLLAQHGGVLEAARADQALQRALALEPSAWGDELRELRRKLADRRADARKAPVPPPRPPPTPRALALYEDARRWTGSDTPELAKVALMAAIAESPGFIDAAALHYALTGEVPPTTVTALWADGEALTQLATALLAIKHDPATVALVRPWLDRAVALASAPALYERAVLRADAGDNEGALADLAAYVASDVNPPRLGEARALRRTLEPGAGGGAATLALARQLLLSDRPREAARALGGPCRAGLDAATLIELGRIEEYEGHVREALACHRLARAAAGDDAGPAAVAQERLARVAARAPVGETRVVARELATAHAANLPAATWALARLARADGDAERALALGDQFLRSAGPGDPLRDEAARAVNEWRQRSDDDRRTRAERVRFVVIAAVVAGLFAVSALLTRRLRGRSVAAALARAPDLYPDVAAAVAELRHDVLKHRASAIGLIGSSATAREEIARSLREPTPTSAVVAAIYERLRRSASGAGVALRPLEREPVFGPLHRALARAERLVDGAGNAPALAGIDRALRERHGPALGELLALCPRTRLDPAEIAGWLRTVADTATGRAARGLEDAAGNLAPEAPAPATPGLHLPALDLEVPVPHETLHTILANLVRNAIAASGDGAPPVLVRVEHERDATGRQLVTFLVADAAARTVTLDEIEQRDGQRGLGIVRDLVRRWGGHLVIRPQSAPFVKAIGAAFPAATSPGAAA